MAIKDFKKETRHFKAIFDQLTPEERAVIRARWGFNFCKPKSLREIAEQKKCSQEWVRMLEKIAEKKMQKLLDELEDKKT